MNEKQIPEENYFFLIDGRKLKNLKELYNSLSEMEDSVFNHHVNEERNDFTNWIMYVFNNESLANKVQNAKTKTELKSYLGIALGLNKKVSKKRKLPSYRIKRIGHFDASKHKIIAELKSIFRG